MKMMDGGLKDDGGGEAGISQLWFSSIWETRRARGGAEEANCEYVPGDDGDEDEAGDDCSDHDDDKNLRFKPMMRTSTTLIRNAGVQNGVCFFWGLGHLFPLSTLFQLSQIGWSLFIFKNTWFCRKHEKGRWY